MVDLEKLKKNLMIISSIANKYPRYVALGVKILGLVFIIAALVQLFFTYNFPQDLTPFELISGSINSTVDPQGASSQSIAERRFKNLKTLHSELEKFLNTPKEGQTYAKLTKEVPQLSIIKLKAMEGTRKAITILACPIIIISSIILIILLYRFRFERTTIQTVWEAVNRYTIKEKASWVVEHWGQADKIYVVLSDGHLIDSTEGIDPISVLNDKNDLRVLCGEKSINSIFNNGLQACNWAEWPLNKIIKTDSLKGICDFSIVRKGKYEYVLLAEKLPDAEPTFACVKGSKDQGDDYHPCAEIASSFFNIIDDLFSNLGEPLKKIKGTYLCRVDNNDESIENIAIVRIREYEENHRGPRIPSGALIYEGMAFKNDSSDNGKAIYWQTQALCIDLFALPIDKRPPFVLFRSDQKQIITFDEKTDIAKYDSREAISNFGQFEFDLNPIDKNKLFIKGWFWDIIQIRECEKKKCKAVIKRNVHLQPIEDAIKENANLPEIETEIAKLWEQAHLIDATLQSEQKQQNSPYDDDYDIETESPSIRSNGLCGDLVTILKDKRKWNENSIHLNYF